MYSHQQGLAVFFLQGVGPDGLFFGFETIAYAFVKVIILSFDQQLTGVRGVSVVSALELGHYCILYRSQHPRSTCNQTSFRCIVYAIKDND